MFVPYIERREGYINHSDLEMIEKEYLYKLERCKKYKDNGEPSLVRTMESELYGIRQVMIVLGYEWKEKEKE